MAITNFQLPIFLLCKFLYALYIIHCNLLTKFAYLQLSCSFHICIQMIAAQTSTYYYSVCKVGQQKTGKLLLGLMTHDVCCNIWVVWAKFAESTMKSWIELPLHQKFGLVVLFVVGCAGDSLLAHFGLFNNY